MAGPYTTLEAAQAAGAVTVNYGVFLNTIVTFLIIAAVVFMLVRSINRVRGNEEGPPPPPTDRKCPFCHMMIPVDASRCGHCTSDLSEATA